jgi:hypothetical protein
MQLKDLRWHGFAWEDDHPDGIGEMNITWHEIQDSGDPAARVAHAAQEWWALAQEVPAQA